MHDGGEGDCAFDFWTGETILGLMLRRQVNVAFSVRGEGWGMVRLVLVLGGGNVFIHA